MLFGQRSTVIVGNTDTVVATGGFTANSNCIGVSWHERLDTERAMSFIGQFLNP